MWFCSAESSRPAPENLKTQVTPAQPRCCLAIDHFRATLGKGQPAVTLEDGRDWKILPKEKRAKVNKDGPRRLKDQYPGFRDINGFIRLGPITTKVDFIDETVVLKFWSWTEDIANYKSAKALADKAGTLTVREWKGSTI